MAADFWGGVKNWWDDVTGKSQKTAGTDAQAAGQGMMATSAGTLGSIAAQDPAKAAAAAQAQGKAQGEEMGQANATAAAQNTARSARTSGLNAGQAAMLGGQATGQAFTQGQQTGQQMGQQAYQTAAANQTTAATGQGAVGAGQAAAGATQAAAGQQQNKDFWGGVSGLATNAIGLLSDKDAKKDVKDAATVDTAAEAMSPKEFKYKEGDGKKQVGVIAQDLEKVAPQNVVDTPAGKAIDVKRQTGTNTAWIVELAKRLRELEKKGA